LVGLSWFGHKIAVVEFTARHPAWRRLGQGPVRAHWFAVLATGGIMYLPAFAAISFPALIATGVFIYLASHTLYHLHHNITHPSRQRMSLMNSSEEKKLGISRVQTVVNGETHEVLGVGHSNRTIEQFIDVLQQAGIKRIVDVRTRPLSQWFPQFNQKRLQASLAEAGIEYHWMGEKLGGKLPAFNNDFEAYMKADPNGLFTQGINELRAEIVKSREPLAVMCSEREPAKCHRRFILAHLRTKDDGDGTPRQLPLLDPAGGAGGKADVTAGDVESFIDLKEELLEVQAGLHTAGADTEALEDLRARAAALLPRIAPTALSLGVEGGNVAGPDLESRMWQALWAANDHLIRRLSNGDNRRAAALLKAALQRRAGRGVILQQAQRILAGHLEGRGIDPAGTAGVYFIERADGEARATLLSLLNLRATMGQPTAVVAGRGVLADLGPLPAGVIAAVSGAGFARAGHFDLSDLPSAVRAFIALHPSVRPYSWEAMSLEAGTLSADDDVRKKFENNPVEILSRFFEGIPIKVLQQHLDGLNALLAVLQAA